MKLCTDCRYHGSLVSPAVCLHPRATWQTRGKGSGQWSCTTMRAGPQAFGGYCGIAATLFAPARKEIAA